MSVAFVSSSPTTSSESSNVTTHTFDLPGSILADDWLVAVIAKNGIAEIILDTPWQKLKAGTAQGFSNGFGNAQVFWKRATGSEGATDTFTTSVGENSATHVYHLRGGNLDLNPPHYSYATSGGTTTSPDPPSLTSDYGNVEHVWIAAVFHTVTGSTSGYPSGYTGTASTETGGSGGVGLATAHKTSTSATEDPGAFTWGTARTAGQLTVGFPTADYSRPSTDYPAISERYFHQERTATTSHSVPIESGVATIILFVTDNTTVTIPSGWTSLFDVTNGAASSKTVCVYHDSPSGSTADFTTSGTDSSISAVYKLTGVSFSTAAPEATTDQPSASTTVDPPSHSPSGGSDQYLWITGSGGVLGNHVTSAGPTNYPGWAEHQDRSSFNNLLVVMDRWAEASSENPGSYTTDQSRSNVTFTISVPESAGGGGGGEVTSFGIIPIGL